jgi:hypothetical protein
MNAPRAGRLASPAPPAPLPASEAKGRPVSLTATVMATTAAVSALIQPYTAKYSRASGLTWASATPKNGRSEADRLDQVN